MNSKISAQKHQTVIIGGGIAGLATATLLAREGHQVKLFERGSELGGRAATISRDGFRFELGPSWYLMPNVFEHFFKLAGTSTTEQLDLVTLDPGYRVFAEPSSVTPNPVPVTVPYGSKKVLKLFDELEPGSAKTLESYLESAAETTLMAEQFFLYNPFTKLSWIANAQIILKIPTLIRLLFTPLDRYVAKRFKHPVLRQILGYPAVFLGTSPYEAPAMYHLMSQLDLDEGVLYPMGGFTELVSRLVRLARDNGVEIVTEAEVTKINTVKSGKRLRRRARAAGVTWLDSAGTVHQEQADTVVSAADLHHTETRLLPTKLQSYPESWWKKQVSGPGAILITLGVEGSLPELPHHSLFFARDWKKNFAAIFGDSPHIPEPPSIYVCKPSATDPNVAPIGHENLFILLPVPADPKIGAAGHDDKQLLQVLDTTIDQIGKWANIDNFSERIVSRGVTGPAEFSQKYHSWQGGMLGPAHILKQSAMFRAQNASRRVAGLFYAGATTSPGVGIPMCLISAELVLKHIRRDHSPGPLPVHSATPQPKKI